MKISIVTLFPKMLEGFFAESIIKRAIDKKAVEIEVINLRDFATDSYGSVDAKPYGGGAGMVLRVDVLHDALKKLKAKGSKVVLTSAKGKQFTQNKARELSALSHLVIVAGHYEGVDERILSFIDEEISLGDFVMTGGEIATASMVDAIIRLLPGVLKKEEATQIESFLTYPIQDLMEVVGQHPMLLELLKKGVNEVRLLEYPHYTRPEDYEGMKVPHVLMSGNHAEIEKWRIQMSFEETVAKRPDLLNN